MKKYCVKTTTTLLECLSVIDCSATGIALAVDDEFRLIGTISDGDIRRALLKGYKLETPVGPHIKKDCFYVSPSVSRAEVLDIMKARRFEQIPIIDNDRKIVGLHLLYDMLGSIERPNWAIVMAGGEGRRLRPITEKIPKPMVKVAGRPILERIVLLLFSCGIRRIFIAVNYLAQIIMDHFDDGSKFGVKIEYLAEDKPYGSGGAISLLPEICKHSLLVINGDMIVDADFGEMFDFHSQHNFYATMGVYPYFHRIPFGCVEIQNGRLKELEEKPVLERMVNIGIYLLSPQAVSSIPKNTYFSITSLFENALKKNLICGAFTIEKEWHDIGSPEQLWKARGEL